MFRSVRQHLLSVFFAAIFVASLAGQSFAGLAAFNEEQSEHGGAEVSWAAFVTSSYFVVDANANAEMQGRLQVALIYNMTDDPGVRDLLSFLLARDTMHQNQWIAAAAELRAEGAEDLPVPSNFPLSKENRDVSYQYINFSDGAAASEGSWASGKTPDGKGEFSYRTASPDDGVPMPPPTQPDERFYGTTPKPNIVEKAVGAVKDAVTGK